MGAIYVFVPNCGQMNGERANEFITLLAPTSAVSCDALVHKLDQYDGAFASVLETQQIELCILKTMMDHQGIKWSFARSHKEMLSSNAKALEMIQNHSDEDEYEEDEDQYEEDDGYDEYEEDDGDEDDYAHDAEEDEKKDDDDIEIIHKHSDKKQGFAPFVWKCQSYAQVKTRLQSALSSALSALSSASSALSSALLSVQRI